MCQLTRHCSDSPISLIASTLASIPELAGTKDTGFAWTVYTGDLVSHDPENELSRDYIEYTEVSTYPSQPSADC